MDPLALALALALVLASCGSRDAPAAAGSRTAAEAPADPAPNPPVQDPAAAPVEVYSAAELARIAGTLGGGRTGRTLGGATTYSYIQGRRTSTGEPELHRRWTDVAYVQAGRALLVTGGSIQGGRDVAQDEERGGTILGPSSRPIAAGDLVVIPAGIAHQYRLAPGETLTYLTVKVPAPH